MEVGGDQARAAVPGEEEQAWELCGRTYPGTPSGTTSVCGDQGPTHLEAREAPHLEPEPVNTEAFVYQG